MSNWSCLYHWFEFKKKENTDNGYQILLNSYDKYDWCDRSKIAIKFGYISDRLLQVVTSQKWGLNIDFTNYIYQHVNPVAAINAGVDRDEYFQILGRPVFLKLNWNYIFISDKNIDIHKITSFDDFQGIKISEKFNRQVLIFDKEYSFKKPFFNEYDLENDKLIKKIFKLFNPLFNTSNINYLNQNDGLDIIFGKYSPEHNDFNFGNITFWSDQSFVYTTNGSYNILKKEKFFGEYKTPILDEPRLIL
jgi:hypothetical protein